jgi:hypothetical protein
LRKNCINYLNVHWSACALVQAPRRGRTRRRALPGKYLHRCPGQHARTSDVNQQQYGEGGPMLLSEARMRSTTLSCGEKSQKKRQNVAYLESRSNVPTATPWIRPNGSRVHSVRRGSGTRRRARAFTVWGSPFDVAATHHLHRRRYPGRKQAEVLGRLSIGVQMTWIHVREDGDEDEAWRTNAT